MTKNLLAAEQACNGQHGKDDKDPEGLSGHRSHEKVGEAMEAGGGAEPQE